MYRYRINGLFTRPELPRCNINYKPVVDHILNNLIWAPFPTKSNQSVLLINIKSPICTFIPQKYSKLTSFRNLLNCPLNILLSLSIPLQNFFKHRLHPMLIPRRDLRFLHLGTIILKLSHSLLKNRATGRLHCRIRRKALTDRTYRLFRHIIFRLIAKHHQQLLFHVLPSTLNFSQVSLITFNH